MHCRVVSYRRSGLLTCSRPGSIRQRSHITAGPQPCSEPPRSRPTARATRPISRSTRLLCRAAPGRHEHRTIGRAVDPTRARHPPIKSGDGPGYPFSGVPYRVNAGAMLLSSTPTRRYRLDRPRRESTRGSLTPAPGEAPKRLWELQLPGSQPYPSPASLLHRERFSWRVDLVTSGRLLRRGSIQEPGCCEGLGDLADLVQQARADRDPVPQTSPRCSTADRPPP